MRCYKRASVTVSADGGVSSVYVSSGRVKAVCKEIIEENGFFRREWRGGHGHIVCAWGTRSAREAAQTEGFSVLAPLPPAGLSGASPMSLMPVGLRDGPGPSPGAAAYLCCVLTGYGCANAREA